MLIIKAKGGLGNRLLSAATAIAYARATGRDWCIDWRDGLYAPNGENAIELMFDVPKQTRLLTLKDDALVLPALWLNRVHLPVRNIISAEFDNQHSSPFIYKKLCAPFCRHPAKGVEEIFWSYTSKFERIKRYLTKEQRKAGRDAVLADVLTGFLMPQKDIVKAADALLAHGPENTLGVHIRYTDLTVPIERVIEQVKEQLRLFNYRYIYLATDSLEAQEKFNAQFSSVIIQTKRYPPKNTQLHVINEYDEKRNDADAALIDLIALSKCRGLVYCSRSSFSETSRLYGDFDRDRLVDIDRFNAVVNIKQWLQERL